MEKRFGSNSIIIQDIKVGVKVDSIRSAFAKFGRIVNLKTKNDEKGTFRTYIKYEDNKSMIKALSHEPIECCGTMLTAKVAFSRFEANPETNKTDNSTLRIQLCNCLICNETTMNEMLKTQRQIIKDIREFHLARIKGKITDKGYRKLAKAAKADLRYITRKIKESTE